MNKKRFFLLLSVALLYVTNGMGSDKDVPAWGTTTTIFGTPTAEQLKVARACGFEWVEGDITSMVFNTTNLAAFKSNCDAAGIKIWSGHLPYGGSYDISTTDETTRASVVKNLKTAIKNAAEKAGITRLVLHPSAEPIADSERPRHIAQAKKSVQELQSYADTYGVTLCVENLPRTCLGNRPEELLEIIEGTNALICYDTNHYSQGLPEHFVDVAGKKIATVHFSDFDFGNECHWLPGQGKIGWGELIHLLLDNGYGGVLMSEALNDRANGNADITIQQLQTAYQQMCAEYEAIKNPQTRLEAKIAEIKRTYFPDTLSLYDAFTPGTDPGFYERAKVDSFQAVYDRVQTATADFDAVRTGLVAALNGLLASTNPVEPGYYWIKSAADYFLVNRVPPADMAMYSDNSGQLKWKVFEPTLPFLFKIERKGDGFSIRNMFDESFIGANATTSQPVPTTREDNYVQYIVPFGSYGNVYIYNSLNKQPYHTLSHASGKGNGSNIVQYTGGVRSASAWYVRKADPTTVATLLKEKIPLIVADAQAFYASARLHADSSIVGSYTQPVVEALGSGLEDIVARLDTMRDDALIEKAFEDIRTLIRATRTSEGVRLKPGATYCIQNADEKFPEPVFMMSNRLKQAMWSTWKENSAAYYYWKADSTAEGVTLYNPQTATYLNSSAYQTSRPSSLKNSSTPVAYELCNTMNGNRWEWTMRSVDAREAKDPVRSFLACTANVAPSLASGYVRPGNPLDATEDFHDGFWIFKEIATETPDAVATLHADKKKQAVMWYHTDGTPASAGRLLPGRIYIGDNGEKIRP